VAMHESAWSRRSAPITPMLQTDAGPLRSMLTQHRTAEGLRERCEVRRDCSRSSSCAAHAAGTVMEIVSAEEIRQLETSWRRSSPMPRSIQRKPKRWRPIQLVTGAGRRYVRARHPNQGKERGLSLRPRGAVQVMNDSGPRRLPTPS